MHRRLYLCVPILAALVLALGPATYAADRPNILWISSEDNGPHLGCYGDPDARTPNLDALAQRSALYLNCWSNAPVCAPARTAIITGMYPPSLGAEHMRSLVKVPADLKLWPQLLREAGYYCSNNVKEDYNVEKPGQVWSDSSKTAHWKKRNPGQPFFAVFNFTTTHESQVRLRPHNFVHDPKTVQIPGYHPDLPETREAWAQYHDQMTLMDEQAGKILDELRADGLEEDTIVFYWGDHGPGLPRCKRSACNSGLRVPLIVHIPEKFRGLAPKGYEAGAKLDRLVEFVDFGPTVLNLAGISAPATCQGRPFLGQYSSNERDYLHGFRGRMDERYDLVRSVRDKRYVYVHNFHPELPAGQHNAYMFETPMTIAWRKAFDAKTLAPEHARFFEPRETEELYDLESDPWELKNLAADRAHAATLTRLRAACLMWMGQIKDVGLVPEADLVLRAGPKSYYEFGHDESYPSAEVIKAADVATRGTDAATLRGLLNSPDSTVRYWGMMGVLIHVRNPNGEILREVEQRLTDKSPSVRIVAAETLLRRGPRVTHDGALLMLIKQADAGQNGLFSSVAALNAIDNLGPLAAGTHREIAKLPRVAPGASPRMKDYIDRLLRHILGEKPLPG
ncbi:sulfatase [Planctomyces sp. SH-PL14]|uniref:sulfatase family protein n=1 Tax=Planctomyces sp. SH-PL14 TaxID=1632864 RepID=UPI00078DA5A3|nr:sulfatase [Planctomyces sp. SH-PL14]AMV21008.1 Arylsulfatase [Planctomyces sp. SH-PL14]